MLDFLGYKIKVDDYVAYPVRHGSKIWMTGGKIVAVHKDCVEIEKVVIYTKTKNKITTIISKKKIYKIRNIKNLVKIIEEPL